MNNLEIIIIFGNRKQSKKLRIEQVKSNSDDLVRGGEKDPEVRKMA